MLPIGSMYGMFTYIYHNNQPNVGKYTIHGSYVFVFLRMIHPILTFCASGTIGCTYQTYVYPNGIYCVLWGSLGIITHKYPLYSGMLLLYFFQGV